MCLTCRAPGYAASAARPFQLHCPGGGPQARGKVIGPAGSVREALRLIEQHPVQAAILDVNLSDGDVTPIAELLIEGGVPVIFYSGLALPAALQERYTSACVCKKPTPLVQLLNKLVASMPNTVETVLALGAVDLPAVRSSPID